jgi:hypothetical protein
MNIFDLRLNFSGLPGFYSCLIDLWGHFKILQNTQHQTPAELEILADSSFFGCNFFIFEALIPL